MSIYAALPHRAELVRVKQSIVAGRRVTEYVPTGQTLRCFVDPISAQARQDDTTATTPSQADAIIFLANGSAGIGDRLRLTRPAQAGVFEITDLRAVFDGYAAHHVEASCKEVSAK